MKRTTTVREYDEQGRVTKETVTEEQTAAPYYPIWLACNCPSTYCPAHPPRYGTTTQHITVSSGTTAEVGKAVSRAVDLMNRRAA